MTKSVYGMQNGKCVASAALYTSEAGTLFYTEWNELTQEPFFQTTEAEGLDMEKGNALLSAAEYEFSRQAMSVHTTSY